MSEITKDKREIIGMGDGDIFFCEPGLDADYWREPGDNCEGDNIELSDFECEIIERNARKVMQGGD